MVYFLRFGKYFENVLPIGPGIKKHPLFFLLKRFRCCTRQPDEFEDELNEYVREEKERVLDDSNDNYAIKIIGLKKKFGKKVAVNNLTKFSIFLALKIVYAFWMKEITYTVKGKIKIREN